MIIGRSKITAHGQIAVPVEVSERLGVGPGSLLEWDEQGEQLVVRRAKRYSSEEIHQAIFPQKPLRQKSGDVTAGVRKYIRGR